MKKLIYGALLSTVLVTGQVYASQTVNFPANIQDDFYCEITGAAPHQEAVFWTRKVLVQGFGCEGDMRGKLKIKAVDINKYYFNGKTEKDPGVVFLNPNGGSFGVNCQRGQGKGRTLYPGTRHCFLSSEK